MKWQIVVTMEDGKPLDWKILGDQIPGIEIKRALLSVIDAITQTTLEAVRFSTPTPPPTSPLQNDGPPVIKRKRH